MLVNLLDAKVNPWPVVGRENELRQVTTAVLDQRGALVSGPAGVGKTTLATAGAEAAHDRGMSVVQTVVTRSVRALPFGAFASSCRPTRPAPAFPVTGTPSCSATTSVRWSTAPPDGR